MRMVSSYFAISDGLSGIMVVGRFRRGAFRHTWWSRPDTVQGRGGQNRRVLWPRDHILPIAQIPLDTLHNQPTIAYT